MNTTSISLGPKKYRYPILLTVFFLGLYFYCLAPSVTWEDSAAYLVRMQNNSLFSADFTQYKLYYGFLKGVNYLFGTQAWYFNALNAVLSVCVLNVFYLLLRELSLARTVALVGTFVLGVSHLFWHYAEVLKVYPLMNLVQLLTIYYFVRGLLREEPLSFLCSGILYGVGWSVHPMVVGMVVPVCVTFAFCPDQDVKINVSRWFQGFLVGLMLTAGFYFRTLLHGGVLSFVEQVLTGGRGYYSGSEMSSILTISWTRLPLDFVEWFVFLGYQYLWLLPLGFIGVYLLMKRNVKVGVFLAAAYLAYAGVAFDHNVSLKINFYFTSFILFGVWVGVGIDWLRNNWINFSGTKFVLTFVILILSTFPLVYYVSSHHLIPALELDRFEGRVDSEYKSRIHFYLWPPKHRHTEASKYGHELLGLARSSPEPIYFILDWQERHIVNYLRKVDGRDLDVKIRHWPLGQTREKLINNVNDHLGRYRVYVGVHYVSNLKANFELEQEKYVYRVKSYGDASS